MLLDTLRKDSSLLQLATLLIVTSSALACAESDSNVGFGPGSPDSGTDSGSGGLFGGGASGGFPGAAGSGDSGADVATGGAAGTAAGGTGGAAGFGGTGGTGATGGGGTGGTGATGGSGGVAAGGTGGLATGGTGGLGGTGGTGGFGGSGGTGGSVGTCCQASSFPGCSSPSVQNCVCAVDPYCCNNVWDSICVGEVTSLGCGTCSGSTGDCCVVHSSPGCSNPSIQSCVCASDSYCCNFEWDSACVSGVSLGCGSC